MSPSVRSTIEQDDRIVVVPWLEHTGVAYRAMDVLAFPSYREGLPNVPLEAQLCGVPVVGYAATGTVDAVAGGIGGVLVPVGDRVSLGRALAGIRTAPETLVGLGRAGQAWVRTNFEQSTTWNALCRRYGRFTTATP